LNHDKDIIIVGCGAGGGTAAQFARKTDRKTSITVFEKGKYPQYSKCGLPYAISGRIPNVMDLIEFSEDWFKKSRIDLLLEATVEKIDPAKKIVYARKNNKIIEKSYGSLIICTGAKPSIPPIKNLFIGDKLVDGVFTLRTIDDVESLIPYVKKGRQVVIVGAGLIGMEMADNLHECGMRVTIVEALQNILPNNLDEDMSKTVLEGLPDDISVFTNHLMTSVEHDSGRIKKVIIKNNETGEEKTINADLLIISTGIKPETKLAEDIGCELGVTGRIKVNNKSETSIKNIYAVGDCTEFVDFITKKPVPVGLGSIVVRQGIAAGINAAGGEYSLPQGVLQTATSDFFGMEIGTVGPTPASMRNQRYISGKFQGLSLPEYYPGGKPITIKVFADEKNGKILGAQAVGDKAAQRINTFACAILADMDVETLRKLETAYAPPVAPTLDVVTLVCDIVSMKIKRKRQ